MKEIKIDDYNTLYITQTLNYFVITYKNTKDETTSPMTHNISIKVLGKSYPYLFTNKEDAENIMQKIYEDLKNKC